MSESPMSESHDRVHLPPRVPYVVLRGSSGTGASTRASACHPPVRGPISAQEARQFRGIFGLLTLAQVRIGTRAGIDNA